MPIVEGAGQAETIAASIIESYLWPLFTILKLAKVMRVMATNDQSQQSYVDATLAIGKGRRHDEARIVSRIDNATTRIALPLQSYIVHNDQNPLLSRMEAIKWLYPDNRPNLHPTTPGVHDPTLHLNSCILAITNTQVDEWNSFVQNHCNQNAMHKLISHDTFAEVDDPHGYLKHTLAHALQTDVTANDVPPHILELKVGDICLIMRPMKAANVASNSRVKILEISRSAIRVETIDGPNAPSRVVIPRMRFSFRLKYGNSFKFLRTQFPLRLAYAMTVNKSQGQTLVRVLEDVSEESFCHGQTYVARSRVQKRENIKVYLRQTQLMESTDGDNTYWPTMINVVYPEILQYL